MRDPARLDDVAARGRLDELAADLQVHGAGHDVDALVLVGVRMRRREPDPATGSAAAPGSSTAPPPSPASPRPGANAERLRLDGYRAIIALLAAKQPLAAHHTPDTATDVLFVLLGPDTFRAFTQGRGWPLSQWQAWVTTTLERDLFTPSAPGPT